MMYEIYRTMVFSTGHIIEKDADWLIKQSKDPGGIVESTGYGWRVYIGNEIDSSDDLPKNIYKLAYQCLLNGCTWLEFDADADTYTDLPVFEWEV